MKQVNLYANGARRHRAGVPVPVPLHAADVGRRPDGHADRRGDRQGRQQVDLATCTSTSSTPTRWCCSPVPVNKPTLTGTPTVGSDAVLRQRRVPQQPDARTTYAWLRNGVAITGATAVELHARPTADLGRTIACTMSATQLRRHRRRDVRGAVVSADRPPARRHRGSDGAIGAEGAPERPARPARPARPGHRGRRDGSTGAADKAGGEAATSA